MKKLLFVLLVVGLAYSGLAEERLIVTSEGQGFWATSVSQKGDQIMYTNKDTGERKSVAISSLHGTVPRVVRGKKYKAADIKKYIARIGMLQRKHKGLYRQLQTLLQEWQALQKPSADLTPKIDELTKAFDSSDKRTKAYRRATAGLGMVRYKDAAGNLGEKLDSVLAEMKADYVKTNKIWLDAQALAADTMGFADFPAFEQLTKDVRREVDAGDKAALDAALARTRAKVIAGQCKVAYTTFVATKSIDSYLDASWLMCGTKENVTDTEEQKSALDRQIASLVEMTMKSNPKYTFDAMGFPLSQATRKVITAAGGCASRGKSGNESFTEQIFMLPEKRPAGLRFGNSFSVPLRLVAQRAQPKGRTFALIVTYPGAGGKTHEIGAIQFKDGVAQALLNEKFAGLAGRKLRPTKEGRTYFYFHLAYKDAGSEWSAISKTCFWDIAP
jgi:hypothetical protein